MPIARAMPKPAPTDRQTLSTPSAASEQRENTRSLMKSAPIATTQIAATAAAMSGASPPTDSLMAKSMELGVLTSGAVVRRPKRAHAVEPPQ